MRQLGGRNGGSLSNYTFVKTIGQGAQGVVQLWKKPVVQVVRVTERLPIRGRWHEQTNFKKRVTEKKVFFKPLKNPEDARQEINIMSRLNDAQKHHSIIHILHVFYNWPIPNTATLVLPYYPDGDLGRWRKAKYGRNCPPEDMVWNLLLQIAGSLNFIHHLRTPILHLDIKPLNVLVDTQGEPGRVGFVLADFGVATTRPTDPVYSTRQYQPPETNASYGFDIYMAGASVYEFAINGIPTAQNARKLPRMSQRELLARFDYDGSGSLSKAEINAWKWANPRRPLDLRGYGYSAELNAVVQSMLRQDASRRPSSMELVSEITGRVGKGRGWRR